MMITCFNAWTRYVWTLSWKIFRSAKLNYIHLMCEFLAFFFVFFGSQIIVHCLRKQFQHVCEEIYGNLHLTNDHTQWNILKSGTLDSPSGQLFTRMWERSVFSFRCFNNENLKWYVCVITSFAWHLTIPRGWCCCCI